jgi:hypothetical protein
MQCDWKVRAQYEMSLLPKGLLQCYESCRMLKIMYQNFIANIFLTL